MKFLQDWEMLVAVIFSDEKSVGDFLGSDPMALVEQGNEFKRASQKLHGSLCTAQQRLSDVLLSFSLRNTLTPLRLMSIYSRFENERL